MRRVRVLLVVMVLALGWAAPAVAEGSGGAPSWSWSAFAEGFVGWAESVWRVVADAEGGVARGEEPEVMTLDSEETADFGSPDPKGEKFPALDPDG